MAALASIDATQKGAFTATKQTLTSADTLTVDAGKKQLLVLDNETGGSLTLTIDGASGTTVAVDGIGSIDVSAGLGIAVGAGASVAVVLSTIRYYCQGVVNLTGAAGLKARLFNF